MPNEKADGACQADDDRAVGDVCSNGTCVADGAWQTGGWDQLEPNNLCIKGSGQFCDASLRDDLCAPGVDGTFSVENCLPQGATELESNSYDDYNLIIKYALPDTSTDALDDQILVAGTFNVTSAGQSLEGTVSYLYDCEPSAENDFCEYQYGVWARTQATSCLDLNP